MEVEVTEIPFACAEEAKVPVPINVTTSVAIIPDNVPVMVAAVVPSNTFEVTAGLVMVNAFAVISPVILGCVKV